MPSTRALQSQQSHPDECPRAARGGAQASGSDRIGERSDHGPREDGRIKNLARSWLKQPGNRGTVGGGGGPRSPETRPMAGLKLRATELALDTATN